MPKKRSNAPIIALLAVIATAAIYFVVRDISDRLPPDPGIENLKRQQKESLERMDRFLEGLPSVRGR